MQSKRNTNRRTDKKRTVQAKRKTLARKVQREAKRAGVVQAWW